jgi:glutamyl-tRNA reductase
MLSNLKLWNFPSGTLGDHGIKDSVFVLRTCQRTLLLSMETNPFVGDPLSGAELVSGANAYLYLLETICGLKSKLIGENEIVGQFKQAYKAYALNILKDSRVLLVLEKLFKDAKDIRTQYLIGISQKTYASLTRRHLIQKARAQEVVIIGSGALAEDLINQFKKKSKIYLCARNTQKAQELASSHPLELIDWQSRHLLYKFPFIANTVGSDEIIFNEDFFNEWSLHPQRLFVDLGSPSSILTKLTNSDGLIRLNDIFEEGAIVEGQKEAQIGLARSAMLDLTQKREALLTAKFNRPPNLFAPQTVSPVRYI